MRYYNSLVVDILLYIGAVEIIVIAIYSCVYSYAIVPSSEGTCRIYASMIAILLCKYMYLRITIS